MNMFNKRLNISTKQRLQMIEVADKLRQSSDDLTHFARTYVITSNPKYKEQYFATLNIRKGLVPRPLLYNAIYWDLEKDIREKKHPLTKNISLKSMIQNLPFTKDELEKLYQAEDNSDELVNLEIKAFNAMDKKDEANKKLAINLLHSDKYYKAKHKIMNPIDDFIIMLNERTKEEVSYIERLININFYTFIIFLLIFIIGNIYIFKYLNLIIIKNKNMHDEIKNLMDIMDTNVIVTETDTEGIITYASKAFCKISGYTKSELIGQPHSIVKHPDTPKEFFKQLWETITSRNIWESEIKNRKKDGSIYWLQRIITPKIDKNGNIYAYTAISYNITSKKEVEVLKVNLEKKVQNRTKEIENIHKKTKDSITYASLIQKALIPQKEVLKPLFKDYFVTWIPRDTVGGDIWLFDDLRHKDECLLFFIDCTGHGVAGAFVTMIVKTIEREIVSKIKSNKDNTIDVSPAWIMSYFNKTIKQLLSQEIKDSNSNAGFDGGIIYYNKRTQILKFSGAHTSLVYVTKDKKIKTIQGDKYSVGYRQCNSEYKYKENIITVENGMKFYCTTDGYLDQNGGEKDFPFGKKRFINIIKENHHKPMKELQDIFQTKMLQYQSMVIDNDRNDDITLIGFEIDTKSDNRDDVVEEIVKYEGVMTQNVIASCIDNIETKISNINLISSISTITIEYCQNMMNYSKNTDINNIDIVSEGEIEVKKINNSFFHIIAKNVLSKDDKEKIEPKLIEIQSLDKKELRVRYRELRKSEINKHQKGAGIGLYEIAKVSDNIKFEFLSINKNKYLFTITSVVKPKIK